MMKRMFITLVVVALLFSMSGCAVSNADANADTKEAATEVTTLEAFEMEKIGYSSNGNISYYRDSVTDVIYIQYREKLMNAGFGGLTAMLDPETGLPLTYTRYMEIYSNLKVKE